jgi:pyruvate/2-oxoglutarate dehydrogenase complex dihydrolipoamide dehydrogenase (E3) component
MIWMRRLRAQISPVDSAQRYSGQLGVDLFMGKGIFTGKNSIEVGGKTLTCAKAVIATGGTAAIPNIPGLAESPYLTNNSIFNLTELPKRFGVIGAGPIGMELAQAFQRLGAQVTVLSRDGQILPKEEPEAAAIVKESMITDGVAFTFNVTFKRIESVGEKGPVRVVLDDGGREKTFEFDALLIATGRKPAVTGLGLEQAGVEFDARLGVTVNERLQTTNPDIYAVGDVAGKYQFTHMADFMARMVIKTHCSLVATRSPICLSPGPPTPTRRSPMSGFTRRTSRNVISPLPPLPVNSAMLTVGSSTASLPATSRSTWQRARTGSSGQPSSAAMPVI